MGVNRNFAYSSRMIRRLYVSFYDTPLFSDNLEYIYRFQQEIETGMAHINHGTVTDGCMPFGGVKGSGLSPFSKGPTSKDFYTTYKVNYIRYTR